MKSFLRFLAVFGVASTLLGGGCIASTPPSTPPPVEEPVNESIPPTSYEIESATTKNGKIDNLRNIVIHNTTGKEIHSPLIITGEARLWYFEAVFPVKLFDASGKLIAQGQAQAQDSWMTEDWVPFEVQFAFPNQGYGAQGTILLMNDNPSGLEENSDSFEIPVMF